MIAHDGHEIIGLGECMVEFSAEAPLDRAPLFRRSFGGDVLNVLAAATMLGSRTAFVTRVASDAFGVYLLDAWRALGIDTVMTRHVEGFTGLYFIERDARGERSFVYYRAGSAASTMGPEDIDPDAVRTARIIHASGITQALSASCRAAVVAAYRLAREAPGPRPLVSYDPNYRPRLATPRAARDALDEVAPYLDIFLPSGPEETEMLLGLARAEDVMRWACEEGIAVCVVKQGAAGCVVGFEGAVEAVPGLAGDVVDTTGAGDAFDGAFLHGLAAGLDPITAARWGVVTAGLKVRGRGAVASLPTREEVLAHMTAVAR